MIIKNAKIYCPDHVFRMGSLRTEGARIAGICCEGSSPVTGCEEVLDAQGCYVIPGLIDIHLHGCVGADFSDGDPAAIATMAEYLLTQGITGFTPTTMTLPVSELEQIFRAAAEYAGGGDTETAAPLIQTGSAAPARAKFLGIHMEGPYFSEQKKGAQPAEHLRLPSAPELIHFQELADGLITQVDVAPELPGAVDFIREASRITTVSLGHTAAGYDAASAGFDAGATHVTHMFNGMSPFAHRDPGVVGAAFDHPEVKVEMICDGVHLHPSMIRSMFRLFGEDRILMISDCLRATGMPDGTYTLGGQEFRLRNGVARLTDGTIAGSTVTLLECLRRVVSYGIPLETAVRCTSENQAKELGIFRDVGSLETGKLADLILLKPDLSLQQVILEGKPV